ncbi:TIGR00299 family protein [Prochlorococcus marinus str. MU1404]|uniref:nickel pincer cofactor biosynthesis protein LarC n=1 Tax=Prochlorococcus marinus TaxID=1219 RepID=UPI001ADBE7F0|nr:nickel pincer cofactor biosynthesis protein LarC [Prochlorococcus marinus]MBO8229692.1 nickel pincer cofactor biosynthesis protein LarC [Prochlorococcus marinus XMU1404]MBW3072770.1 TIGR00299 family protein [Prochlorococcus marinus str. MU1404]MCR8545973.1 nickel pincer cofactor biosynthesis protein LarC [Prochlorococcus marinus CUG1432]
MEDIYIECSPGISGDMLLGAFYDLGVPKKVIEQPLVDLGLTDKYNLDFKESRSCSILGIKTKVESIDCDSIKRNWRSIKELILNGHLEDKLQQIIFKVFESLASAEGKVHGIEPEDVHFHEIGAIDSLVDIIGVCAALNYLNPKKVYCNEPMLGKGFVQTEHGKLSVPPPAVIELVRKQNIKVVSCLESINGELSTPTGIALLSNLVDYLQPPSKYSINSYGVGIGNLKFPFPNLVRVYKITSFADSFINEQINPKCEEISVQEAWIDDQTPEDISNFVEKLRIEGAYDVSYQAINMKKNRIGFSIQAILPIEKKEFFRQLWFDYSNTIGVRERTQSRWILLRRRGECSTTFGNIKVKQTLKPDGSITMKPENDEVFRLKLEYKKSTDEIRKIIKDSWKNFKAFENWK